MDAVPYEKGGKGGTRQCILNDYLKVMGVYWRRKRREREGRKYMS